MDKVEYKIRADEIKALIGEGRFAEAVKVADTIDWKRVKSVSMLCTISDLYKINRRFQESKDVLLMAYDRHPTGRAIVYSLCELAIKMGEFVQAVEYYKEFVRIAPRDTGRYILQYKLYEAQEVSLEERIAVLEEFKKHDYRERWAYELAYLYHRVGLTTECIEECDEIFLWFGEGRYVMKALELKALHEPLSPEQQDRYIRYKQSHGGIVDASIVSEKDEVGKDETRTVEIKQPTKEMPPVSDAAIEAYNKSREMGPVPEEELGETKEFIPGQPLPEAVQAEAAKVLAAEAAKAQSEKPVPENPDFDVDEIVYPHISEIKEPSVDVSTYNTINLQESLAKSLREVMGEDSPYTPAEPKAEPQQNAGNGPVQPITEEIFDESETDEETREIGQGYTGEIGYGNTGVIDRGYTGDISQGYTGEISQGYTGEIGYGNTGVIDRGYTGEIGYGDTGVIDQGYTGEIDQGYTGEIGYGDTGVIDQGYTGEIGYDNTRELDRDYTGEISYEGADDSAYESTDESYCEPADDISYEDNADLQPEPERSVEIDESITSEIPDTGMQEVFFDTAPQMGIEIKYGGNGPILGEEKVIEPKTELPIMVTDQNDVIPEEEESGPNPVIQPFRSFEYEEKPLEDEVPGAVIHPNASYRMHNHFEDILSQDNDGQLSMAVEPEPEVEKQITGQISIQEYLENWEQFKKDQKQKQFEAVKQRVADETGDMFSDFDEKTKVGLQEKIEKAIADAIKKESYAKASGRGDWSVKREDVINSAVDEVISQNTAEMDPVEPEAMEEVAQKEEPFFNEEADRLYEAEAESRRESAFERVAEQELTRGRYADPQDDAEGELQQVISDEMQERSASDLRVSSETGTMSRVTPEMEAGSASEADDEIPSEKYNISRGVSTDTASMPRPGTYTASLPQPGEYTAPMPQPGEYTAPMPQPGEYTAPMPQPGEYTASLPQPGTYTASMPQLGTDTAPIPQQRVQEAAGEKKAADASKKRHMGNRELAERVRTMTPEEKELFGPYIHHKKSRRQIIDAIDNLSMDAYSGNAIVTGEEGAGTVNLAKGLIKAMQASDSNFSGKVAKITANTLNKKSTSSIFDKLANGALIIQRAADLEPETVNELLKILQEENKGLVIVMEDTKEDMDRFLEKNPSLKQSFNVRVDIEALDDDSLVAYARQYALEKEYAIDNLGILALHTRISERQTLDHDVTVSEVKDIVDDAIYYAEKRSFGHFVDILVNKRYDENDMIILREKDFMHD